MEKDKLAHIAAHLDETQIVSLQDLEELERLQLTAESDPAVRPRSAFPLSAVFGVVLGLLLVAVLAAGYVVHARSAVPAVQSRGSR